MESELELPVDHPVCRAFDPQFLALNKWLAAYPGYYRRWLEEDDASIYQCQHPLNRLPIRAAQRFNAQSAGTKIFYWMDVDRSLAANSGFCWATSPLSGERLTDLGPDFPSQNRLVALKDALVMPWGA